MLVSCLAGSGDVVFSLLHAGTSHFSFNRQVPILSLGPCGFSGIETRVSVSLSSIGEGDAVLLMMKGMRSTCCPAVISQSCTRGGMQMLHGGCPSKHGCVFPAGVGRWPSSHWGGKMFLQTLPQPGCSRWVWLKMPKTFRHAFLVPTRFLKDIQEMKDGDTPVCGSGGGGSISAGVGAQGLLDPSSPPRGCRQPFAGSVLRPHQPCQLPITFRSSWVPTAASIRGVSPSPPCTQTVRASCTPKRLPLSCEARVPSGCARMLAPLTFSSRCLAPMHMYEERARG